MNKFEYLARFDMGFDFIDSFLLIGKVKSVLLCFPLSAGYSFVKKLNF